MRTRKTECPKCLIVLMGLFITGSCFAQDPKRLLTVSTRDTRDAISSYVVAVPKNLIGFGEPDAEYLAELCGVGALPALTDIINDENVPRLTRSFAAMCIGKIGEPESAKTIIQFIQSPRSTPVDTSDEFTAIMLALVSLGFIGTDECAAFLKSACSEDYWLNREDRAMLFPDEATVVPGGQRFHMKSFRGAAIGGVCALPPAKALEVLQELRGTSAGAGIASDIDVNIRLLDIEVNGSLPEKLGMLLRRVHSTP